MKLVVIESPFAGNTEANLAYARKALMDSLNRGEAPLASHLLYPQVLNDSNRQERLKGIACGLAWAEKADYAVFYMDLGMSSGMISARNHYDTHGIPYIFRYMERTDTFHVDAGRYRNKKKSS